MASLAELNELIGFFSYARDDDTDFKGALSALRERIRKELRGQLGRSAPTFKLWQDTLAIPHGALWEKEINQAVAQSVFFIPIITPSALNSSFCREEFDRFLEREAALGRDDLIFPILYIRVPALADEGKRRDNYLLNIIHARQYANWTHLRLRDVGEPEYATAIESFCRDIHDVLHKQWISPEERARLKEEEARQQEAQERLRRQAEDRLRYETALREQERSRKEMEDRIRQGDAAKAEEHRVREEAIAEINESFRQAELDRHRKSIERPEFLRNTNSVDARPQSRSHTQRRPQFSVWPATEHSKRLILNFILIASAFMIFSTFIFIGGNSLFGEYLIGSLVGLAILSTPFVILHYLSDKR
jgi:hypothetical protein